MVRVIILSIFVDEKMNALANHRLKQEVDFTIHVVGQAARLVKSVQQQSAVSSLSKADHSPVTVADFASQALVARQLMAAFPQDLLVAEENADELRDSANAHLLAQVTELLGDHQLDASPEHVCGWVDHGGGEPDGRFWTLDPIDGTKGFLRGDQYVVAMALIEGGQVVLGALGCPKLNPELIPDAGQPGSLVLAVRGEGVWAGPLDGTDLQRVWVSRNSAPERAKLLLSVESSHTDLRMMEAVRAALGNRMEPVRMDSQAKLAVLAGGHADLLFRLLSPSRPDYKEKIWDQAAGSLIVEEAGGRVTDLRGAALDFSAGRELTRNTGVLVSNGRLHDPALRALREAGAA